MNSKGRGHFKIGGYVRIIKRRLTLEYTKMILYGSQTSPFVRRLRLVLKPDQYEFRQVDIFSSAPRAELKKISPLLKLPILQVGETAVWDSRVIFNELVRWGYHPSLTLNEENLLTAMSDGSDSLIQILLAERSKITFPPGSHLHTSHFERVSNTLEFLDHQVQDGQFSKWNFLAMSLYAMIDWIEFRKLVPIETYSSLIEFRNSNKNQPLIAISDPRIS